MRKILVFLVCALALASLASIQAEARSDFIPPDQTLRLMICPGAAAAAAYAEYTDCKGHTAPTRPMEAYSCERQYQNSGDRMLYDCLNFGEVPLMSVGLEEDAEETAALIPGNGVKDYIQYVRRLRPQPQLIC